MELEMNNDIFIKVSELLENGAKERDHDFHIMTFCTIGKEGVEARSVVLRNFDKDKNIIGSINPTKIINTVFGGRKNNN